MTDQQETTEEPGRRRLLKRLAAGSGLVVAGAVAGGTVASASGRSGGWKRQSITFDVACLGETWRDNVVNYAEDESDFSGMPFSVEGWIYPENFIPTPGDGFVPVSDGSIGRWLCRGTVLVRADRLEPHVQTTQEFIFGTMSGDELFPDDTLTTAGNEGTFETHQIARRSVTGGTGAYMGATGEEFQDWNGFNTSVNTDGTGNAPNFRMRFDLLLPDL